MPVREYKGKCPPRPASPPKARPTKGYKVGVKVGSVLGVKDAIMVVEKMIYEENTQRAEFYGQDSSMYNEDFSDGWLESLRKVKRRLKRL